MSVCCRRWGSATGIKLTSGKQRNNEPRNSGITETIPQSGFDNVFNEETNHGKNEMA